MCVQPSLIVVYTSWKLILFWEMRTTAGLEVIEQKEMQEGQVWEKRSGSSRNHKSSAGGWDRRARDVLEGPTRDLVHSHTD